MSPIPMLAILSSQVLIDGLPVDESGLESTLNAKQEINAMLGGDPIKEIVVQVGTGVSETRVERFLGRARSAGFVQISLLSTTEQKPPREHTLGINQRRPTSR